MTADPLVSTTALRNPTAGWNRYAYVEGDPVNLHDPSGLLYAFADDNLQQGLESWSSPLGSITVYGPEGPSSTIVFNPAAGFHGGAAGGGGGAQSNPFIRVRNPSKTGQNQDRIRTVMNWISENIDADCAAWLSGIADAIVGLLGDPSNLDTFTIGHRNFDTRIISAFTGNSPNQTDLSRGYAMIINSRGAFFVGSYTEAGTSYQLAANGYAGGTSQTQVAILLHELAHFLNFAGLSAVGFQPDFNNPRAGSEKDRLIRRHCQRTLDAASNIP